jgi:hypothetical protein
MEPPIKKLFFSFSRGLSSVRSFPLIREWLRYEVAYELNLKGVQLNKVKSNKLLLLQAEHSFGHLKLGFEVILFFQNSLKREENMARIFSSDAR